MTARIAVRLTPGGGRDGVEGWGEDDRGRPVLKVRVRARPVEGAANAALTLLIAKALAVPKSSIRLARGATSRVKTLEIEGLNEAEAREKLAAHLNRRT